ncbi:TauD/TfdA family dioxygenase [Aestuariicella sp. G3-2]|uniref:TauD/TfdA dioxygenase family protein n=1 Tax=Pseudomaricurvus albidus TaxID=2842452 RepID=UPI001C0B9979|nr:TauD/TfdA family dioxygenase [Aestuariicella albida]MBU3069178.1 TauD/TfdA family dioxygenase [Aestuariicella albida]
MTISVTPTKGACGAFIDGLDLRQPLSPDTVDAIRQAWLQHHVVVFRDQQIDDDDLERFSRYFGDFAGDPYIAPMAGRENVIELRRAADETTPIFADAWHTDWSFGATPPAATVLHGITIPPHGGNTDFINQHEVLAQMPAELRQRLQGKMARHSARLAYAPDGMYGQQDKDRGRGFTILTDESAYNEQLHPLIRQHPETGEEAIFGCFGYIVGIADVSAEEEQQLLTDLYQWQTREEFQYHHQWQPGMLVMWDNRSVLHKANGGYEGYERVLHRTVIA